MFTETRAAILTIRVAARRDGLQADGGVVAQCAGREKQFDYGDAALSFEGAGNNICCKLASIGTVGTAYLMDAKVKRDE